MFTSSNQNGLNFDDDLARALHDAGVDVVSTANNHALDRYKEGVLDTLDALDDVGMLHTGTRRSTVEPWYTITDAKGFTLAWLACTQWTNKRDNDGLEHVLSCRRDHDAVLALVKELAHMPGIDGVIVTPHGAAENRVTPDDELHQLARDLAEAGALAVVNAHAHNVQTWEKVVTADGREVPVLYSRGNPQTACARSRTRRRRWRSLARSARRSQGRGARRGARAHGRGGEARVRPRRRRPQHVAGGGVVATHRRAALRRRTHRAARAAD